MSNCKNCGCNQIDCGCKDKFLTTPPPCPTPEGCPDPQPCSEVFDSQCIIYTASDILCGETIVVEQDANIQTALQNAVDYFCNSVDEVPRAVVAEGDNVTVTENTVGNVTTYTVSSNPTVRKFVTQFTSVFDNDTKIIPKSELTACGLLVDGCGYDTFTTADFTYAIYYLQEGVWISIGNLDNVTVRVTEISGDISINFNIAPVDPAATVRVVIIG
jgi:hypothetical protein